MAGNDDGDSREDTEPRDDRAPRERLIDAAVRVVDDLPLSKAFAGATSTKVAHEAGVTTGSYFHHFRSTGELIDAVVMSRFHRSPRAIDAIERIGVAALGGLADEVRLLLEQFWIEYSTDPEHRRRLRLQMGIWAHNRAELTHSEAGTTGVEEGRTVTVADVLRTYYRQRTAEAVAAWERLIERSGRSVAEPFDLERIAVAFTAMFEGLLIRHQIDPDGVDDSLFTDTATAFALAVTIPRGGRIHISDLSELLIDYSHLSPQARSGARRRQLTRQRITEASIGMFDNGWERVAVSDIAAASDVSSQTVLNLFGSARGVAASTFARMIPDLQEVASPEPEDTPARVVQRILTRLAECVSAEPEAARALLGERLHATAQRGSEFEVSDIRVEVPIGQVLLPALLDAGVDTDRATATSSMLINFVLAQGSAQPVSPSGTAELAMRLLGDAVVA